MKKCNPLVLSPVWVVWIDSKEQSLKPWPILIHDPKLAFYYIKHKIGLSITKVEYKELK